MRIDVHGHVAVKEVLRSSAHPEPWRFEAPRDANGWQTLRNDRMTNGPIPHEAVEWSGIVEALDATKVDLMAVSPVPFLLYYYLDDRSALETSRAQNDAIAAGVAAYPRRFVGLGTVPLQNVDLAVKELERVVCDLRMPGIEVGSNVEGTYLGHERLRPFWEAVQALDALVFVHPMDPLGADKLRDYYLINLIGNPVDTTRCIADVVFSGLLEEFPRLKLCFAHAGGTVPYIGGRWEHGYHVRKEPKVKITRPPSEYLKLLYFDTITHSSSALEFLVKTVGADHVVVGSDYPFDMGPAQPVSFVEEAQMISAEDKRKIISETPARLLKLS